MVRLPVELRIASISGAHRVQFSLCVLLFPAAEKKRGFSPGCKPVIETDGTLAYDQHFPHVVARQEEFDRAEIAEQIFDVAVVEDSLQREPRAWLQLERVLT